MYTDYQVFMFNKEIVSVFGLYSFIDDSKIIIRWTEIFITTFLDLKEEKKVEKKQSIPLVYGEIIFYKVI